MDIRSIAAAAVLASVCGLPFAATAQADIRTVPLPQFPCNLPLNDSLLIWQHAPGVPDRTMAIPQSDMYNCRPKLDTWRATQPTGPGYCSKIAWGHDNREYVYGVTPAAPLKNVIDQVGDC